eukprot:3823932-Alexandrium_andersonii.AAC.1
MEVRPLGLLPRPTLGSRIHGRPRCVRTWMSFGAHVSIFMTSRTLRWTRVHGSRWHGIVLASGARA